MARTNTYKCAICGTTYEFCLRCQVSRPDYDAEKFCSKNHAEIYGILSKHGCNLITADEALKELSTYDLKEIAFTEDILAHIEKINSEANVKVEEPTPVAKEIPKESIVKGVQTNNKNNKKKW